ncbi:MAG: ArnT family glycosyltransferase, partial [Chloroflexota bacterium]
MRIPLLLYGLAVLVRTAFMLAFPDPAYPDSFYYVDVARALASGHGLSVDFVWIFAEVGGKLPTDAVLPIPSNAHWLPLASFIQAPFVAVMGANAIASALPMVLIGSLAAPLTWFIARDIGASRTVGLGAGVMSAIPAAGAVFMAQPENFAIFQPLVAATLWCTARGLRGDTRAYALAGLLVGLASIARNDAFLLGAAVGLVFVIDRVRAWRRDRAPRMPWTAAAGCLALYLLVVVPWWYRQLSVFGSISPTASTGTALWLTDYRQWNSITADVSLSNFLAQGPAGIIGSRIGGLVSAAANFALIVGSLL